MLSATGYILLSLLSIFIYYQFFAKKSNKKLPPAPSFKLPIVGHAWKIGKRPHHTFQKWAETYGNIMSVQLGPAKTIILNDYKLIKEMFNDMAFSGRPQDEVFLLISEGSYGVLNSQKETWEAQRRFTLRHLRDFGFGKSSLESVILVEAKEVVESFQKEVGRPFVVTRKFSLAVLNSLWTIVTGKRNSQDDPQLLSILTSFLKINEELSESGIILMAPWLMKIFPEWTKYNSFLQTIKIFGDFIRETMTYHKETLPDKDSPRDFVDAFYHKIQETTDTQSTFYGETGEQNLYAVLGDLFQAGAETTSATLSWTMLYLGGHQEIQKKLHAEIDHVIGQFNPPSLADRAKMPFTEAVIQEVLRKSSIVPLGVFHVALADKEFQGYTIEKGSWITANLWSIHHDSNIWEKPEEFNPERFLSEDGKSVKRNEALIPFLVGKRQCLGEQLARDTLLFICSIFQKFHVSIEGIPDYEPKIAFLVNPKPYNVVLKDRLA